MDAPKPVPEPSPSNLPTRPSGRSGMAHSPRVQLQPRSIPTDIPKSIGRCNTATNPEQLLAARLDRNLETPSRCRIHQDLRSRPYPAKRNALKQSGPDG